MRHHDLEERGKWERDLGRQPQQTGKSGASRATKVIATSLGLRETQVTTKFNRGETVAGAVIGWKRSIAYAVA